MRRTDLDAMSLDELWTLHCEINTVLAARMTKEKTELEHKLARLKRTVTEEEDPPPRKPYPEVLPKFRNPQDGSETWSGRGKTPRWLSVEIEAGKAKDDFRIERELEVS